MNFAYASKLSVWWSMYLFTGIRADDETGKIGLPSAQPFKVSVGAVTVGGERRILLGPEVKRPLFWFSDACNSRFNRRPVRLGPVGGLLVVPDERARLR